MIDWACLFGYDGAVTQRDRLFHKETEEEKYFTTGLTEGTE